MCEYCEFGVPIVTERDNAAVMVVRPAPIGFEVVVAERWSDAPTWVFKLPRCPICGEAHPPGGEPIRSAL